MNLVYLILGITSGFIYSYIPLPTDEKDLPTISPTMYPLLHNGMVNIPIGVERCFMFITGCFIMSGDDIKRQRSQKYLTNKIVV